MKLKKIFIFFSLLILIGNLSFASQFDYQGVPNVKSASIGTTSNQASGGFPYHIFVKVAIGVIAIALIYYFIFKRKKENKDDLENIEVDEDK